MRFATREFYVKSEEEMAALFPEYPEAIENTAKIAALCQMEFQFGKYHLPEFQLPEDWDGDSQSFLEKLCQEGFRRRYPNAGQDYKDRLDNSRPGQTVPASPGRGPWPPRSRWPGAAGVSLPPGRRTGRSGPRRGAGAGPLGQTAVAITDHGVMYGAVDFYRACKAEGVHPVIGCEVYVTFTQVCR